MKHPKTLLLLSGREVKVLEVAYPYGKNTFRVHYEHAPNHKKGCIAELWPDRFQEVEPKNTRQYYPTPLRHSEEPYE